MYFVFHKLTTFCLCGKKRVIDNTGLRNCYFFPNLIMIQLNQHGTILIKFPMVSRVKLIWLPYAFSKGIIYCKWRRKADDPGWTSLLVPGFWFVYSTDFVVCRATQEFVSHLLWVCLLSDNLDGVLMRDGLGRSIGTLRILNESWTHDLCPM